MNVSSINSNTIHTNLSSEGSFTVREIKMRKENGLFKIRLKSPHITPHNYALQITDGILTLKVMLPKKSIKNSPPAFSEYFLVLPYKTFNHIINSYVKDGFLHVHLKQKKDTLIRCIGTA